MKTTFIKLLSASIFAFMVMVANVNAQNSATSATGRTGSNYETGPHGGLICPAFENYKFEMVYHESDKKVDIYFLNPEGNLVEAGGTLTGEVTFVNEDKSNSKVNSSYENKKFTVGVPDGNPLFMCGIVLTHNGQMYGGKFINPSLIK